jgi:hypothetical protein
VGTTFQMAPAPLVPTLTAAVALVMLNIGGVALVVERFYL